MMNILLVMPRVPYALNDWNIPPIGILYISSALKQAGFCVHPLNLMLYEGGIREILQKEIREKQIHIVATGDLVVNYQAVKDIVDAAKCVSKDVVTIIGGGLVTHSPMEAMELIPNADYGIMGEGELAICALIQAIGENQDAEGIPGIVSRKGDRVVPSETTWEAEDLDALPWPDYEGFRYFDLLEKYSDNGAFTVGLTTSRSCPFSCTFCSTSGGRRYRQRSLDAIFAEMEYLIQKYHVTEFFLNDELFAVNEKRILEFCQRIEPYHVKWHVMLRISKHIQPQILQMMEQTGCEGICYGMESADDGILQSMKKGITVKEMLRVLQITKQAGIKVRGGFIFGDPEESKATVAKTLNWLDEHMELLENVSISPIVLYPGSQLYQNAVRDGKIKNTTEFIRTGCPLVNVSRHLSQKEYEEMIYDDIPFFAAKFRYQIAMRSKEELRETLHASGEFYQHRFRCRRCGQENVRRIYPEMMFQSHFVCPHCTEKYDFFPGFLYLDLFKDKITQYLQQAGVAIWGAGQTTCDLFVTNEFFRDSREIMLLDSSEAKQERGFMKKRVLSPKKLEAGSARSVVCCVGNVNFVKLKESVFHQYPLVKSVVWVYEIGLLSG